MVVVGVVAAEPAPRTATPGQIRRLLLKGPMPTVAVVCGSRSDLPTLKGCFDVLDEYGIGWEASVISAHRQAETLHAYVDEAERAGVQLFIGAAGLAAHLPGVLASLTAKPVIGIPLDGGSLGGADALYAVVQMPPGVPVATVAIGSAGRRTPRIWPLASWLSDAAVAERVSAVRADQAAKAELRIDRARSPRQLEGIRLRTP